MTPTARSTGGRLDTESLSAECALAQRPAYRALHADCRQTKDVPLPHSTGLLLVQRCQCPCHAARGVR